MINQSAQITVFSATHCPSCQTLKAWLDKQGLKYESVNLEEQPHRQAEVIEKSGSFLVPITIIKLANGQEEIVQGTEYGRLKKILGI